MVLPYYRETNCKVLSRRVTKAQCRSEGGKSWKKTNGMCEKYDFKHVLKIFEFT